MSKTTIPPERLPSDEAETDRVPLDQSIATEHKSGTGAAGAPPLPSPPLGQIVNWAYFAHTDADFDWDKWEWTPTNAKLTFNKLYANTAIRCDVMLDALTSTNGALCAAIYVDGQNRMAQGLAGAPAQSGQAGVITFGFSNAFGGELAAGKHEFALWVAVQDSSKVTFVTTQLGIQCYEILLPTQR